MSVTRPPLDDRTPLIDRGFEKDVHREVARLTIASRGSREVRTGESLLQQPVPGNLLIANEYERALEARDFIEVRTPNSSTKIRPLAIAQEKPSQTACQES